MLLIVACVIVFDVQESNGLSRHKAKLNSINQSAANLGPGLHILYGSCATMTLVSMTW